MAQRKRLGIGIFVAIGVVALVLYSSGSFSVGTPSQESYTFSYTHAGNYQTGVNDLPLTSGSFSMQSRPPNIKGGESATLVVNGKETVLQKGVITKIDEFVTATYQGSSVSTSGADAVPFSWSNSFSLQFNPLLVKAQFPSDEPTTIAVKKPFKGKINLQNPYIDMQGNMVILESSILVFVKTTSKSQEYAFTKGTTSYAFDVDTSELLGHHVEVIPTIYFSRGNTLLFGFSLPRAEHDYRATPGGFERQDIDGKSIIVIPVKEKGFFRRLFEKIYLFFTRRSS